MPFQRETCSYEGNTLKCSVSFSESEGLFELMCTSGIFSCAYRSERCVWVCPKWYHDMKLISHKNFRFEGGGRGFQVKRRNYVSCASDFIIDGPLLALKFLVNDIGEPKARVRSCLYIMGHDLFL